MSEKTELPTVPDANPERCRTCRHLDPGDRHDYGWCRRFPPVYAGEGSDPLKEQGWYYPWVHMDGDWCGEWQPKPFLSAFRLPLPPPPPPLPREPIRQSPL